MLRVSTRFVNETLWPEFVALAKAPEREEQLQLAMR